MLGSLTKRPLLLGGRKRGHRSRKAHDHSRSIVLIDESGLMLQPVVRRTWAPRGQTPIQHSRDGRDRLSVISAISMAPRRRRLGLYSDS